MPKIDLRNALRIKTAAGEVSRLKWQGGVWPSGGAAVPSLSVPFVLFVARDANLANGKWQSRFGGGLPAGLEMDAHGSPAIVTDQTWAPGVPVMSMAGGCWFADRDVPFPAEFGFSVSYVGNMASNPSVLYNGPPGLTWTDVSGLHFGHISGANTDDGPHISAGDGNLNQGRRRAYSPGLGDGVVLQFDRPFGADVTLPSYAAYADGAALLATRAASAATRSNGTRFIVGGQVRAVRNSDTDGYGEVMVNTSSCIMAVLLTVGGTPMTAADRATWQAFAEGLKTGAVT